MRTRAALLAALTATSLVAGGAAAGAGPRTSTAAGGFDVLDAGVGTAYEGAHGSARIRRDRTADTTTVWVVLNGLASDTHYGAHLHVGSCDAVGGHYQHDPGGEAAPPNELWPVLDTDHLGRARTTVMAHWVARPEAASVVVHDPATGAKVLCAGL